LRAAVSNVVVGTFFLLGSLEALFAEELHDAVRANDAATVRVLLEEGAEIDQSDFMVGTALHIAITQGSTDIAALLIDYGADLEAISEIQQGARPLHLAAGFGDMPVSTLLIQSGADIEARDDLEQTPLIRAAAAGHEGTVRLLLDAGAAVDSRGGTRQRTPLLSAAYFGHLDAVKLLTERGADVTAADRHGENALHFAVGQAPFLNVGGPMLIEFLVANGTDMNAKNNSGLTPIAYAKLRGAPGSVEAMRRLGAIE